MGTKSKQNHTQHSKKTSSSPQVVSHQGNNSIPHTTFGLIFVSVALISLVAGICLYDFWRHLYSIYSSAITLLLGILATGLFAGFIKSDRMRSIARSSVLGLFLGIILTLGIHALLSSRADRTVHNSTSSAHSSFPNVAESNDISSASAVHDSNLGDMLIDDISDDLDVVSPEVVIASANNYLTTGTFLPSGSVNDLLSAIDADLPIFLPEHIASNKPICAAIIYDEMKNNLGTETQPSDSYVNGNSDFASLTSKANNLEAPGKAVITLNDLKEIIRLREQANAVIATRGIRNLLSNNYHQLARFYRQQGLWEDAYTYYLKAISMNAQYLHLHTSIDDDFYAHLYRIALLYQCIGDIPTIDSSFRFEAYYLSALFLKQQVKTHTRVSMLITASLAATTPVWSTTNCCSGKQASKMQMLATMSLMRTIITRNLWNLRITKNSSPTNTNFSLRYVTLPYNTSNGMGAWSQCYVFKTTKSNHQITRRWQSSIHIASGHYSKHYNADSLTCCTQSIQMSTFYLTR